MDNHSLLKNIRNAEWEAELKRIYVSYRHEFFLWAIRNYKCTPEDAEEIYQQTMIIFYENIVFEKLKAITTEVKTYIFSIGKNKIREYLRKKKLSELPDHSDYFIDNSLFYGSDEHEYENKLNLVEHCITQLGEPCKSILVQFYYQKKSMSDIADHLNYKNSDSMKTQKFKCIQRLKSIYQTSMATLNINRT
jgi:RNA polymerase sigma-70 factor (ECF subfamily)